MKEDFYKIGIVLIIIFFIIYLALSMMKMKNNMVREGMTNASANGEAGNATSYAASIKAKMVQLQDSLLIPKYRADYENTIINMDDYFSMLMLKTIINIDMDANEIDVQKLNLLNSLSTAKKSLNETMTFVDKQ